MARLPLKTAVPPSRRPAVPPTRRPVDPPSCRPAVPPSRRPADPPSRRPAIPPSRRPADPPSRRPVDPPTRRPAIPPSRHPAVAPTASSPNQNNKTGQASTQVTCPRWYFLSGAPSMLKQRVSKQMFHPSNKQKTTLKGVGINKGRGGGFIFTESEIEQKGKLLVSRLVCRNTVGRRQMRNLCLVGSKHMANSSLLKPLKDISHTYDRPDGGTYQLESIIGSEIIFSNDFEYNDDAKKWLNWSYFKNMLEGGSSLPVARPKNRGGNVNWLSDAPCFLTAAQEVSIWRGRERDECETDQARCRIRYIPLRHEFTEDERRECKPCGHCGARGYLEGLSGGVPVEGGSVGSLESASGPPAKRPRAASDIVREFTELQGLFNAGIINSAQANKSKEEITAGLDQTSV